jgi:hypothetical protein
MMPLRRSKRARGDIEMTISMRLVCCIFAFVASHSALAQEKFSIEINQKMDSVLVEDNRGGPNSTLVVDTQKDSNERRLSFNRDIKALGIVGKIDNCSLLIDVPAGTMNHSYGGFCSLRHGNKRINIYICNDDMVGHFALYHDNVMMDHGRIAITSKETLIKFVVSNCLGG